MQTLSQAIKSAIARGEDFTPLTLATLRAEARDATIMRALTSRAGKCGMDPRHCPACRQTRAFIGL